MSKSTFWAILVVAILGAVVCFFVYKQGERSGSEMSKQQYDNIVSDLQGKIDSLGADRKKLLDSASAVQLKIDSLNHGNDSLISKLYNLDYQHKILKLKYAKISHYDSIGRSDILRYVADSVSAPVR